MKNAIVDRLAKLCDEGESLSSDRGVDLWFSQVLAFLKSAVGPTEAAEFENLKSIDIWEQHALQLGHLQGLVAKVGTQEQQVASTKAFPATPHSKTRSEPVLDSRKVFVVHGHDNEAKEGTARFLGRLGLHPIILHEQPSSGRTVIEKFETYSDDIAFAVVLLTPDDLGNAASDPTNLKARARQNVIMELGYFMGRLGRPRVCALYKGGVELPSDYQGVIYVEMDPAGAWKAKLAQEFVQAKLPIDLSGLVNG